MTSLYADDAYIYVLMPEKRLLITVNYLIIWALRLGYYGNFLSEKRNLTAHLSKKKIKKKEERNLTAPLIW